MCINWNFQTFQFESLLEQLVWFYEALAYQNKNANTSLGVAVYHHLRRVKSFVYSAFYIITPAPLQSFWFFSKRELEIISGKERFCRLSAAPCPRIKLNRGKTTRGNALLPPPGGRARNNGVLFLASPAARINVFQREYTLQTVSDGGGVGPPGRPWPQV